MNKIKFVILSLLTIAVSFSANAQWDSIKGSKDVVTKERNVKDFTRVKAGSSVNVYLKKGSSVGVSVEADDNFHEHIDIKVYGETLEISSKKNFRSYEALNIYVTFTELEEISAGGSTDVYLESEIDADDFELSVGGSSDFEASRPINAKSVQLTSSGSSDVEVEINASDIDIQVTGSSDLELEGTSDEMEISVTGSADFMGSDFKVKNCYVSATGSADAYVYVTGKLSATATGSADVYYKGAPDIQKIRTTGSADINRQ